MLKVSCDDGSTNVKLAWLEDGEVRTSLSGNSFKEGWNRDYLMPAKFTITSWMGKNTPMIWAALLS